jgi:hypothetical protein
LSREHEFEISKTEKKFAEEDAAKREEDVDDSVLGLNHARWSWMNLSYWTECCISSSGALPPTTQQRGMIDNPQAPDQADGDSGSYVAPQDLLDKREHIRDAEQEQAASTWWNFISLRTHDRTVANNDAGCESVESRAGYDAG